MQCQSLVIWGHCVINYTTSGVIMDNYNCSNYCDSNSQSHFIVFVGVTQYVLLNSS